HDLLGAGAIVANDVIEFPFFNVVVDDDQRISAIGEVSEEMMPVVATEEQNAIDVSAFEDSDVLFRFEEVGLGLFEHYFIAKFSGAVRDAADEFAKIGVTETVAERGKKDRQSAGVSA